MAGTAALYHRLRASSRASAAHCATRLAHLSTVDVHAVHSSAVRHFGGIAPAEKKAPPYGGASLSTSIEDTYLPKRYTNPL
jgi:hypothetical protein